MIRELLKRVKREERERKGDRRERTPTEFFDKCFKCERKKKKIFLKVIVS